MFVVSEVLGVYENIADACRCLPKEGYLAIAPELFSRYGDPRKFSNAREVLADVIAKTPGAGVMADLDNCAVWTGNNGWRHKAGDHRILLGRVHHVAIGRA